MIRKSICQKASSIHRRCQFFFDKIQQRKWEKLHQKTANYHNQMSERKINLGEDKLLVRVTETQSNNWDDNAHPHRATIATKNTGGIRSFPQQSIFQNLNWSKNIWYHLKRKIMLRNWQNYQFAKCFDKGRDRILANKQQLEYNKRSYCRQPRKTRQRFIRRWFFYKILLCSNTQRV